MASEFATDEQRHGYIAALVHEKNVHEERKRNDDPRYNKADHDSVLAELKRLGVDPKATVAPKPAEVELDGEFVSVEQRDAHIEALKREYQLAESTGDKTTAAEVKAELARLAKKGKPAKTKVELDEKAEKASVEAMYDEEHRLNPGLVDNPEGKLP